MAISKRTKKIKKTTSSKDIAKTVAQAAYDVKAEDLAVLDLSELSGFTDFFVIASGRSDRQVQAIGDRIREVMKKEGLPNLSTEGYQKGHWLLMDYGSVVAHIFYQEARDFYAIEKLWSDAPRVKFKLK